ncbi:hypothetical protein OTU49_000085 [Cherax quadricarinatus]|uniref:Copper transporter n=1 Tax=Cherax quadricarinatus TaxID=27406 RepID=A0AAW0Y1F4_CHEQU
MSSSFVLPKSSVGSTANHNNHRPDRYGSDDNGDTVSDCGSLCTCTSSSLTSLDTCAANRDPNRLDHNIVSSVSQAEQQPTGTQVSRVTTDNSNNSYFVVFVPPQMVSGRRLDICGNCQDMKILESLWLSLLKICEICLWVASFLIIYYSFQWWGLGPGFSAFLFMIGAHAFIRLMKTQGALQCSTTNVSQRQQEAAGRAQVGGRVQQEQNAVQNSGNEKPPSYEAAVVKPPPYDLQFHLTPTQPCSQTGIDFGKEQFKIDSVNVPKLVTEGTTESALSKEDVFLPSYQDAIRLSFSSDKDLIDNQGKD